MRRVGLSLAVLGTVLIVLAVLQFGAFVLGQSQDLAAYLGIAGAVVLVLPRVALPACAERAAETAPAHPAHLEVMCPCRATSACPFASRRTPPASRTRSSGGACGTW